MKAVVIVFPGSNCDSDCFHALKDSGFDASYVWHKETVLPKTDLVVLPGGFSYGDYLRTGAIAKFSPVMREVKKFGAQGGSVIGICNGFQILLEAGMLPGAMLRNRDLAFICRHVFLRVENQDTRFTNQYEKHEILSVPIAHGEGNYFAEPRVIEEIEKENLVAFRYVNEWGEPTDAANPNGSQKNIAGIFNKEKNILGMMPHPERAMEKVLGSDNGKRVWASLAERVLV